MVATLIAMPLALPHAAVAQPPTTVAGLLAHYQDLSREAEKVSEQLLAMQEDVAAKRQAATGASERAAASTVADAARAKTKTAREDMDRATALLARRRAPGGLSA